MPNFSKSLGGQFLDTGMSYVTGPLMLILNHSFLSLLISVFHLLFVFLLELSCLEWLLSHCLAHILVNTFHCLLDLTCVLVYEKFVLRPLKVIYWLSIHESTSSFVYHLDCLNTMFELIYPIDPFTQNTIFFLLEVTKHLWSTTKKGFLEW